MANPSLQIGNDNWAIKEDNLLGYSTAGTRFVPQPITMTRASAGTRVNSSGLVETVELLGSEEVTNGTFETSDLSDFDTTYATQEIVSEELKVTLNTANGYGFSFVTFPAVVGRSYRIQLDAQQGTSTGTRVMANSGLTLTASSTGTGTWSYEGIGVATATTCQFRLQLYGVSGDYAFFDNVSVKEYTANNLARVDYTDGTSSLLVEPERTNLVTYSSDFSGYSQVTGTITANSTTSPDGTLNASVFNALVGLPNFYTRFTATVGLSYAQSIFLKKGTRNWVNFVKSGGSGFAAWFDLENGVIGTVASGFSANMEDYGNGWYRCSVISNATITSPYFQVVVVDNNDSTTNSVAGTIFIWGTQAEQSSYLTSLIPADGGTVTRVQDQYSKTGISNLINSTEGVLFVEMAALANDGTVRYLSINDGTSSNRVTLLYYSASTNIRAIVSSGGTNVMDKNSGVSSTLDFHKVAIKWKVNDFAFWIDGVKVQTDTSGLAPIGLNTLSFDVAGSGNFFGKVKQLQVFKTALTDSELATLTT